MMRGCLPDFLGIGVQKGGTTTLQRLLEQHPQVYLPRRKELHYFSLHYGRGEAWYRQQFADAEAHHCSGEITPYYAFHPQAPQRIQALVPKAKLILLLRDPVDRALSQVAHSMRLGLEPLGLEEALNAEAERLQGADVELMAVDGQHQSHQEHSYLARSRYEIQLARWCEHFSSEQLLIRRSEDLFEQPERVWAELLAFLELPDLPLPEQGRKAHVGSGELEQLPSKRLMAMRALLHEQLATTYAVMLGDYGLSWID
jgi:hypothetical protein